MSDINWGVIRDGSTFQDLICCLIRLEDNDAYLYVRPGKDYGLDARSGNGRIAYQMKFHENKATSSIINDAKKEAEKIAKNLATPGKSQEIWQGVEEWILITNVAFNPSDSQKWNNEVEPLLAKLGLKASYWEKSVIETNLLKYPDLKQAYFGGETRVFLGIAEASEQVRSQGLEHPHAVDTHYQGRKTELNQYKNFINNANKKILVIHGPGGIGKTRFLLEGAKTQALSQGWQVFWANVATMTTNSSWFMALVSEHPTLVLMDEPNDTTVLKALQEQILSGRAKTWKVAIAVRSPKDPILKFLGETRIKHMVEMLPLAPLDESAAVAFCQELLELGFLQAKTADWKKQAATWIAQHYDYPIWMAIAIKLLESKGNLERMPQEIEGLASEYLEEIINQSGNLNSETILNILRWTALFDTVNREDPIIIEWIREKVKCKDSTQLQGCFNSLINRKVIFEGGVRNRLLKIKPDVLADHILGDWLIYKRRDENANSEVTCDALEIVEEASKKVEKSTEFSSIQRLLLRSIARFELIQQLCNNPINLLGRILTKWDKQVPSMNAHQKLAYLSLFDEISFAHVSEVVKLLRAILNSTSEPKSVSTIFGERIITHDDVILALPWTIYSTALYAQTADEQKEILSLLCDLVIEERSVATRRPQGLPNDGKRAETILPIVIAGSSEFCSSFEISAFEKAKELLNNIRSQGNISEDEKLYVDTIVKPLLSVEKQHIFFDGRTIISRKWTITPEQSEWAIRDTLRTLIKKIISEQKLQPTQAVILWNMLAYAHGKINHAASHSGGFSTVLTEDLQWVADFLNSHSLDIQELTAARQIWDWHYQFEKDPERKKIAIQCETFFKENELFLHYAPLLSRSSYEVLERWATEISQELVTLNNSQSIHNFVQNGVKFLRNPDQIPRLFIVASPLGAEAQQSQSVRKFVEEALQMAIETPEFQFATKLSRSWIWTTRQNNPPAVLSLLEELLEWSKTSHKIVTLIQSIYEVTCLTITEPEIAILLKQQKHFKQVNSEVSFVGLLGQILFSSSEQIKNIVDITLDNLDSNQLSTALDSLLQSLDYGLSLFTKNTEETITPSLISWILDQVLRLPDIDNLSSMSIYYIQNFLKILGKPDLQWLLSAVEKRIQMVSESNILILPTRTRLSKWIDPIALEQTDDITIRNIITKLLSYADSYLILSYTLPEYLTDVDPTGVITSDLVVGKLADPQVRKNPDKICQWSRFAGYYPDESPAWRKIAREACTLAAQFDNRQKYLIFYALTNPEPKVWMSNIGEVPEIFEMAVKTAQQRLETETDPLLIPFWKWILQLAEAELSTEIERVKEQIEEWVQKS